MGPHDRDPGREVDEEITWHLDRVAAELMEQGWDADAARAEARRRFGDVDRHRSRMVRLERGRRRMRTTRSWIDGAQRHLGFAVRSLMRAPGFTLAVVLTLALGIGANATMFRILDRLFLAAPSHVVDGERVRNVYIRRSFLDEVHTGASLTLPDVEDLDGVAGIEAVAGWTTPSEETVGVGESTLRARIATAEPALFPLLGVSRRLGRIFTPDDDAAGATPVALVSPDFAERRLGGEADVLGRSVQVGDVAFTVVGVVPPDFTGPGLGTVDLWLPLRRAAEANGDTVCAESRNCWWLRGVVRIGEGEGALERAVAAATPRTGPAGPR